MKYEDTKPILPTNYMKFWGTRGSIPVAGPMYDIYGGNTACLEIQYYDQTIIIDAGTGIRKLGYEILKNKNKVIHLFISHFHWDHILGFPFFLPIHGSEYQIHIYAPGQSEEYIKRQFEILLKPEFFPVGLKQMSSNIVFHCLSRDKVINLGKLSVSCCPANHPGNTYCFRIGTPAFDFGYVTDNEFISSHTDSIPVIVDFERSLAEVFKEQVEFFKGSRLMIHEAQYFDDAYRHKVGWGHSSIKNATILMSLIQPREWVITHHDPEDTDPILKEKREDIARFLDDYNLGCKLRIASEGMVIPI